MSQEIDLGGVKVTAADWEATPESIKEAWLEVVRQTNERLGKLEGENEHFPAASGRIGRGTKEKFKELVSTASER